VCLGKQVMAGGLEREGRWGALGGQVCEHGPKRPAHIGVHVCEKAKKTMGKVGEGAEDDAPHPTERIDIITGSVRHGVAAKRLGHVGKAMGREAREGHAREREGIDPGVGDLTAPANRFDKRAVKRRVVREDGCATYEFGQTRHCVFRIWRVGNIKVCDAGELGDGIGNGGARMNEGLIACRDGAAGKSGRRDLDEPAVPERKTRRFGVENHDVILEQPEVRDPCPLCEGQVATAHALGRSWQQKGLEPRAAIAHLW